MKMFSKFGILFTVATMFATVAAATSETVLTGDITIEPKAMHPGPVKGQLKATFADDVLTAIKLKIDKPIMGRVDFPSVEQWSNKVTTGATTQLALAFRLFGPPHGWFFVYLGSSNEGITFDGKIYKVRDRLDAIKAVLKDGKLNVPANWKTIGTSTLKF